MSTGRYTSLMATTAFAARDFRLPILLNPNRLDTSGTICIQRPFPFVIGSGFVHESARASLREDFPRYPSAGFFPHDPADCGPSVNDLIAEIESPSFADAVGAKLDIERLSQYPTLVTLCRSLNKRHGTIHTDSKSKVATALLYLNDAWPETSDGCLRFLARIDDIESLITPEITPLFGNFVVFRRAQNSFHGHLPYEGERRVIQIAWLTSEDEKRRKTQRGKFTRLFKKLLGALDRRWGAGRDKNAAHRG